MRIIDPMRLDLGRKHWTTAANSQRASVAAKSDGNERVLSLCRHEKEIVCVAFNPHGNLVATGSTDATAKLWHVESGQLVHDLVVKQPAKQHGRELRLFVRRSMKLKS